MTVRYPPESLERPLTTAQLKAIGQSLKWRIMADILLALSGVEIFGVQVFAGLSSWAEDLRQRADDAISDAFDAQSTANYANVQLALLASGTLAANVSGGVSVDDQFNGSSANDFGGSWSRTSDGAGGGYYGPNGSGKAVWKKSGGLGRRHIDRYTTPLSTDYQIVAVVFSSPPPHRAAPTGARNYLCSRMNSAGTTFVYAAIGEGVVEVGKCVAGTWTDWDSASVTVKAGDQWSLIVGTTADDRQVIVRQNGVTRLDYTDSGHSYGASYRYAGMGAGAASYFLVDQAIPGELDLWAAADRLAAAV